METDLASTSRPISRDVHVDLRGEVTMSDVADLRARVEHAIVNQQSVLIDCASVSYFDNAVLEFLANLRIEARMLGVSLQIQGLPGSVLANAAPRGSLLDIVAHRMTG